MALDPKATDDIIAFFQAKVEEHGATPKGLDWNGTESHEIRLANVCKAVDRTSGFSINDYGCGYGALAEFMERSGYSDFRYRGTDITPGMIETADKTYYRPEWDFAVGGIEALRPADFTVASGVFNKIMTDDHASWMAYVKDCLRAFHDNSHRAFSCNFLTSYSDVEYMRNDLFYPDPRELFDFGMGLSRSATILHDYGLYDFTLIVRKA